MLVPRIPDRDGPFHDGFITRLAWARLHDIGYGENGMVARRFELRPLLLQAGEVHVGALDLAAGESFFDGEAEAD